MKRFHLSLLVALLLLFTPRFYAARSSFPSPSTARQQTFRPKTNAPFASQAGEFESEKRKVPTGSNPLHNKRLLLSFGKIN